MANKLNNATAGLAGLLQGINFGRQQGLQNQIAIQQLQNQNQTTQWANPYRKPGDLDVLKVENDPMKVAMAKMMTQANQIYNKPPQQQAQESQQGETVANSAIGNWKPVAIEYYKANKEKAAAAGADSYDPDTQTFHKSVTF